jgi:phytoene dehydrogenase-like protein
MTSASEHPVRDDVREFIHKSEETIAESRQRWAESLRDFKPGDGAAIRKFIGDAFDFSEKLLKNQRQFAESMLDRLLGEAKPAPKKAAPKKAPSKKAPAKKAAA